MTTLVTGATGFLGRHLVRELIEQGDSVRALVRGNGNGIASSLPPQVEILPGEITNFVAVREAAAGCRRIFHLAGIVSHRRSDVELMQKTNVDGTHCLLDAADDAARIVHVSSVATLGPVAVASLRADESDTLPGRLAGRFPYAAAKRESELVALAAARSGRDVVIANPGFLLGPGDVNRVSTWPVFAYVDGKLRFTTDGGLAFVDARDVARGLVALARNGRSGERTILASEQGNLSWDSFFELVSEQAGIRRRTVRLPAGAAVAAACVVPRPVCADEVRAASNWWFASGAKAARELGFSCRPLAETVADTIADRNGGL